MKNPQYKPNFYRRCTDNLFSKLGYFHIEQLDFARDLIKRLDEHRELVETIEKETDFFEKHPWHKNHTNTQDEFLQILMELRHGKNYDKKPEFLQRLRCKNKL